MTPPSDFSVVRHGSLIVVLHPRDGNQVNGKQIVAAIRAEIAAAGKARLIPAIFHDASKLEHADMGYVAEFSQLEKATAGRTGEVVCAIPCAYLRVLARTVSWVSGKSWMILDAREAALARLKALGHVDIPQACQSQSSQQRSA